MSINWHTKSQVPKKSIHFSRGGFTTAPWTLLVIRVVLLQTLYGVLNPLIPQLYILNYFRPWAKDVALVHDSYLCKKYNSTPIQPFPTRRKKGLGNFVGSIPELKSSTIIFSDKNQCPVECRPKNHKDWKYC